MDNDFMLLEDQQYMQRCFDLAMLGKGHTSPNPIVGAVLVHKGRIIGEGYHRAYRQAHAEVNAVASVKAEDRPLIPHSTLYVSLEPCNIHRNTPPCTLLILRERIPRVVIAYLDHTPGVDGSGVERLRKAGVEVKVGVLQEQGRQLSQIRNTFVQQNRPYIILKWAQSADGFFAPEQQEQLWLSNAYSKRLVHKWRSETDAILVGYQTARSDNPKLNNRLYYGGQPCRILIDREGSLPEDYHLMDGSQPTIVITENEQTPDADHLKYMHVSMSGDWLEHILHQLAELQLSSVIVEGGIKTISAFLEKNLWDEARVLTASRNLSQGRRAPVLPVPPKDHFLIGSDRLSWYLNSLNLH
jgi:diaminohydroxyphosphoribosylaminopyrimidine deaminase/5-amino-6-(5-phosphoribosylamino)uracil reductase